VQHPQGPINEDEFHPSDWIQKLSRNSDREVEHAHDHADGTTWQRKTIVRRCEEPPDKEADRCCNGDANCEADEQTLHRAPDRRHEPSAPVIAAIL
jgi:hypothetical protein